MKFSVRIKVLGFMLPAILIMLGLGLHIYLRDLKESYLHGVERRAEGLALNISLEIEKIGRQQPYTGENVRSLWEGLSGLCEQLYEASKGKGVAYIAVVDKDGNILAHNDPARRNTRLDAPALLEKLGWDETNIVLIGAIYHTLIPLKAQGMLLGALVIGVPQASVDEQLQPLWKNAFQTAAEMFVCACLAILVVMHFAVTQPLKYLVRIGDQMLEGNLVHTIKSTARGDEIALLAIRLVQISHYLRDITDIAEHVATGRLKHEIQRRSKRDNLSLAFQQMLTYLQNVAAFASKIAGGDLTEEVLLRSDVDAFGRAMRTMRSGLHTLIQQIRDSAEQLAAMASSIASLADQDKNIVEHGQTAVETLVATMMQMGLSAEEIASNMGVLSSSVEETSASVLEMTESIGSIASSAAELEQQTQKSIAALANATHTLESVTAQAHGSKQLSQGTIQDALEGQQAVEQVTASMDTIHQTNSRTVATITRFAQQTEDIGTILDVIDEVTDQSSLLALNASIIAAQAGSHGKGFAVIADEMRNLAHRVSASTKNIATIVQTVQQETHAVVQEIHSGTADIEQGVKRTQQARKVLEKIIASAQRSSTVVTDIVTALQHMQKTTGQDMKIAMERVHSMTAAITRATSEQKSSTLQINQAVEHIRDLAVQTQAATSQQLEGVQQVLDVANTVRTLTDQNLQSSQQVEDTANDLKAQAQSLLQAVDRFKLRTSEMLVMVPLEETHLQRKTDTF